MKKIAQSRRNLAKNKLPHGYAPQVQTVAVPLHLVAEVKKLIADWRGSIVASLNATPESIEKHNKYEIKRLKNRACARLCMQRLRARRKAESLAAKAAAAALLPPPPPKKHVLVHAGGRPKKIR